jgi:hypothetical protein
MKATPEGLDALLERAPLPDVALLAAVEHRALHPAVSRRARLPGGVVEACFTPGLPPAPATARRLVDRHLTAQTVRHILEVAREDRPEVLAALATHNVPAADARGRLLAVGDPGIDASVLANPAWPVTEQIGVARRADGASVLAWLAQLDVGVTVWLDDLLAGRAWRPGEFDADIATALQALLRRPWLAELPFALAGPRLRSAIATVTADERTLYRVLGRAQRLAGQGRTMEAAGLIEAVACNPAAPLAVQRRARRLARRIPCHYLAGWLPARAADGPLERADAAGQRRTIVRLEQLARVRHRTVITAGLLAANPRLEPDVRTRLIDYLDTHLHAVDAEGRGVGLLADRLGVDEVTRTRWQQRAVRAATPAARIDREDGEVAPAARPWAEISLRDCTDAAARQVVAQHLAAAFGTCLDAWAIGWLLLREGWTTPLAGLPAVVTQLLPTIKAA